MPYVDLSFSIQGSQLPSDYAYPLFSAIARIVPAFHGNPSVGIHPMRVTPSGNGGFLLDKKSRLTIRLDANHIKDALPLAGKSLNIAGSLIQIGVPTVFTLIPAAALHSRMVTIKGFQDPEPFREALLRKLDELNAKPEEILIGRRRTLKIQDKRIVGFGVQLLGLTAVESLDIQEQGIGGRRRFGCGVFQTLREKEIKTNVR